VTIRRTPVHPGKVLFPLALGTAVSQIGNATLYTVLPTHTAEAGITLGVVGILLSANRAIRLLLNGPMGLAYDRWPRRWLFVPALFGGVAPTILYATTRGFWSLLAARLLPGNPSVPVGNPCAGTLLWGLIPLALAGWTGWKRH
jgi:DHA1 family multidrug resistance protein-like MFS transporter